MSAKQALIGTAAVLAFTGIAPALAAWGLMTLLGW